MRRAFRRSLLACSILLDTCAAAFAGTPPVGPAPRAVALRPPVADSARAHPVLVEGGSVLGALWQRDLYLERFRFRRNGKRLGGKASIHVSWNAEPQLLPGIYLESGELKGPSNQDDYTDVRRSRRPKKCGDTGCDASYTDACRWFHAHGRMYEDFSPTGTTFCNPLTTDLEFSRDNNFGRRSIGSAITDGVNATFLNSPAAPSSGTTFLCEARPFTNSLGNKPAYVEYQWQVKRLLAGALAGAPFCSDTTLNCGVVQYYQFGQINGCTLRSNMELNSLDLIHDFPVGTRDVYFMFDTDANVTTGDEDPNDAGMCGAEYRVHVAFQYVTAGAPQVTTVLERYNTFGGWTLVPGVPLDVQVSARGIDFKLLLTDLAAPSNAVSSWVLFAQNNVISGSQPCDPCNHRITAPLGADANCPTVVNVDDSGVRSGGGTGAVEITFSAPMLPISQSQLSLSPPLPAGYSLSLLQTYGNQKLRVSAVPEWPPGHYTLTLDGTIQDCSHNGLADTQNPDACGTGTAVDFCTEESHLVIAAANGTAISTAAMGQPIFARGTQFPPNASVTVYVVQEDDFDTPGSALVDYSSDGPNVVVTDAQGNLPLTNIGEAVAIDGYNVVVDVNNNGLFDAGDRVAAACGTGLDVGPECGNEAPVPPMALWSLDQATGLLAGERTEGMNGVVTPPAHWVTGRVDGALEFDGATTRIAVAANPDLLFDVEDFSVATWVRTTTPAGTLVSHVDGTGMGWELALAGGRPVFSVNDGTGTSVYAPSATSPNLANGDWHLVIVSVTRNSSTGLHMYSDLSLVLTSDPTPRAGAITPTGPLSIGARADATAPFAGDLDEVALYDEALANSDVATLYAESANGGCLDSVAAVPDPVGRDGMTAGISLSVSPNPAREAAAIRFSLPGPGTADVQVLDTAGRRVSSVTHQFATRGTHLVSWTALDAAGNRLSPGIYLVSVRWNGVEVTRKLTLLR